MIRRKKSGRMDDFETLVETITKKAKEKGLLIYLTSDQHYPASALENFEATMRICEAIQFVTKKEKKIIITAQQNNK